MAEVQLQTQGTPVRRRQNPPATKAKGKKAYASENDAASVRQHRNPQTPHKQGQYHPGNDENSKKRGNQKIRSKNTSSSPESSQPRHDGLPKSVPRPIIEPAFAGATFHASPSPASLPMPSFLPKVASESPGPSRQRQQQHQQFSPPGIDNFSTPQRPASETRATGSPLDFMFRAHREEQDKQRRDSANGSRPAVHGRTPSSHTPAGTNESPHPPGSSSQRRGPASLRSRSFFDGSEIDDEPSNSFTGPAFSTPYQERIRAARGANTGQAPSPSSREPVQDPTDALKKFLFGGMRNGDHSPSKAPSSGFAPPGQPPASRPVQNPAAGRSQNIQAMENDLRRILKMDN